MRRELLRRRNGAAPSTVSDRLAQLQAEQCRRRIGDELELCSCECNCSCPPDFIDGLCERCESGLFAPDGTLAGLNGHGGNGG
jgi:hypothetical protein